MFEEVYLNVFLACFDGEEGDLSPGGDEPSGSGEPAPTNTPKAGDLKPGGGGKTFTQAEVNEFLAKEKRKHQEKYQTLEVSYEELLANQSLSQEERTRLESQLEDVRKQFRTKEQQLAHEKKEAEERYQRELTEALEKGKKWETRYTESTIQQALQSAAIKHEAYNPSQVVTQLRSSTKLVEAMDANGKPTGKLEPMVEMTVADSETGATEVAQMTPNEAVEYLKKSPELWGNLFRNNVVEGIGSSSITGGGTPGKLDPTKMSDEQYFKMRAQNPEALGIGKRRR